MTTYLVHMKTPNIKCCPAALPHSESFLKIYLEHEEEHRPLLFKQSNSWRQVKSHLADVIDSTAHLFYVRGPQGDLRLISGCEMWHSVVEECQENHTRAGNPSPHPMLTIVPQLYAQNVLSKQELFQRKMNRRLTQYKAEMEELVCLDSANVITLYEDSTDFSEVGSSLSVEQADAIDIAGIPEVLVDREELEESTMPVSQVTSGSPGSRLSASLLSLFSRKYKGGKGCGAPTAEPDGPNHTDTAGAGAGLKGKRTSSEKVGNDFLL